MKLIVILLCVFVQRLLKFNFDKPYVDWFMTLYSKIEKRCGAFGWWSTYGGVLVFYAAIVFSYVFIVAVLSHFFGFVFTFLLSVSVLWYYLDAKPGLLKRQSGVYLPEIFINRYYGIFAVLFWFVVLGPLGVILYSETVNLSNNLKSQQDANVYFSSEFLQKLLTVRSVIDWVPVRLVGLTYALVGQFRPAFQYWCRRLTGLETEPLLVVDYGMISLNWDPNATLSGAGEELIEVESLTNRALCVWLVVLAIFTVGGLIA